MQTFGCTAALLTQLVLSILECPVLILTHTECTMNNDSLQRASAAGLKLSKLVLPSTRVLPSSRRHHVVCGAMNVIKP